MGAGGPGQYGEKNTLLQSHIAFGVEGIHWAVDRIVHPRMETVEPQRDSSAICRTPYSRDTWRRTEYREERGRYGRFAYGLYTVNNDDSLPPGGLELHPGRRVANEARSGPWLLTIDALHSGPPPRCLVSLWGITIQTVGLWSVWEPIAMVGGRAGCLFPSAATDDPKQAMLPDRIAF
ncbi:uncharacterized protein N7482_002621 [Penicillium canariense]|uniref:Uncharacterized protein n=1 Tax=Penicillium canariense TaxID=189055 RepID=A0A9W9II43_9EURO|nr:uncharacterized protein N7482_002621 [Penicillium canariense]KAJ5176744.1 hypothetical protein N7482_002621 [Penicillium canariense]